MLAVAHNAFDSLLRADLVQMDGQVLLGTPLGADSADVHVGSVEYRARKIRDMVDQHDDRLRHVVALARREVSVAAAVADWPKRIRDMRYVDHEDYDGTD